MLLAPERDVVRVDDDEEVEETGDDQERVAVLVRNGADVASAVAERRRKKKEDADPELRERLEADERIGKVEREDAALEREADREHQRQRDQKNESLRAPAEPEMAE